jgi:hypothetical protein
VAEKPSGEFFWLIERGQPEGHIPPLYWDGTSHMGHGAWVSDANEAAQFLSKEEADAAFAESFWGSTPGRAVEHAWFIKLGLESSAAGRLSSGSDNPTSHRSVGERQGRQPAQEISLTDEEVIRSQGRRIERLGHALKLIRDGRCPCGGRFKWLGGQTRCEQCDLRCEYGYGHATTIAKEALDG